MGRAPWLLVVASAGWGCGGGRRVAAVPDAGGGVDSGADADADSDSDSDSASDVCDADRDGHDAPSCGGDDCDDADARIHPGAREVLWMSEDVDDAERGMGAAITIDADDVVHVAYGTDSGVRLASQSGRDWATQEIESDRVWQVSIAPAADGTFRLGWTAEEDDAYLASNRTGDWVVDLFDTAAENAPAVAVHPDGFAAVAYGGSGFGLRYVSWETGTPAFEDLAYIAYDEMDLVFDSAGVAHLAASDVDHLDHWTDATGEWTREVLDADPAPVCGLAITPDDRLFVAYFDAEVRWGELTDGEWTTEVALSGTLPVCAMAVGREGAGHVVGTVTSPDFGDSVEYATDASGAWIREIAIGEGWIEGRHALAVDSSGVPHLAYQRGGIRHAWRAGADGTDQDCDGIDDE